MAVQVRDSTANSQGNSPNPFVTVPATVQAGDLLIAFHTADTSATYSGMAFPSPDPLGEWSQLPATGTPIPPRKATDTAPYQQPLMEIFYKIATVSDPGTAYTFVDANGANGSVVLVAVFGQEPGDDSTVLFTGVTYGSSATAATSHPAPSVTGVAGGLLITAHCGGNSGATRTYTPPTGMTELQDTSITSGWIVTEVNVLALAAAGATGNKDATCSASCPYVTASLVVVPAAAPPAGNKGAAFLSILAA